MVEEKFLIDSSSFMTPYKFYYAFDLVPAYWNELSKHVEAGGIVLLDLIKKEIEQGQDQLTDWIHENETKFISCNHISEEIILKYQKILQYIQECGYYNDKALYIWSQAEVADPWLIAASAVNHYTIITNEVSAGTLNKKTPSRNPKIPDVAKAFGVKTESLFYMMRKLGIRI